jgi:putative endopeptidase
MAPCIARAQEAKPFFPPFGIELAARDTSTRPGDDFYQYQNGGWLARTPIPRDLPEISTGREQVRRVEARVRQLLEAAAARAPVQPKSLEGKAGAMYAAFMDEKRVNALGVTPIRGRLDTIAAAPDHDAIAEQMGRSFYDFGKSLFYVLLDVDRKNPEHYGIYVGQSGLGMPDRDYYFGPQFAAQRAAYRAYLHRLLKLIEWKNPSALADSILAFETRIAGVSWPETEQRDFSRHYNPMTPEELASYARGFPWAAFLGTAGLGAKPRLIVVEKSAVGHIAAIFGATPLEVLKGWMAFTVADAAAPYLAGPFQKAFFEFREKTLLGQRKVKPRWKRAVRAVSGGVCVFEGGCFGTLNWAVGQVYVAHDFTPHTKAKVEKLVTNLLAVFRTRIQALDWMDAATKQEALKKLDMYRVRVGYPDRPRDYSTVLIRSDDLIGDVRRAAKADWDFYLARADRPVDRAEWEMTPQTVEFYNGGLRDILYPAAFLQPPRFDPNADEAVNYGTIGATIGHELTHGVDDLGQRIDASGLRRDWWTPADHAAFKARAAKLGEQFAQFEPLPGMRINADLTMGENIADLGGLLIALDGYHYSLDGKPAPVIDGFTGDQRLFMAYAQVWRGKANDDFLRQQVKSNPHSWRRFRVLGPISNVDAWYEAFEVKAGDKMYRLPKDRVRIW